MSRVAILIDGDNIASTHADQIVEAGREVGRVDVLRAYVNAANGSSWPGVPGVETVHAGTGKNAADLRLTVDGMELALTGGFDTFVLASSDRDFTHLATRLRAHGRIVIGLGEAKTSPDYRRSCTRFVQLGGSTGPRPAPGPATHALSPLDQKIRELIESSDRDDGSAHLAWLGKRLRADGSGVSLPAGGLKKHLVKHRTRYQLVPADDPDRVRLRPPVR